MTTDIPGLYPKALEAARAEARLIGMSGGEATQVVRIVTAYLAAVPKSEGAVTGEPKVWIGRDDLEFLSRNPMSTATVWGADRAGNRNHVALYLAPSNPLPAAPSLEAVAWRYRSGLNAGVWLLTLDAKLAQRERSAGNSVEALGVIASPQGQESGVTKP